MPDSIIEKVTKKAKSNQTQKVKLTLTVDKKLAEDIEFIINNSKTLINVDSNVFFVSEVIDPYKKTIEGFAQELREKELELSKNSQHSSETIE